MNDEPKPPAEPTDIFTLILQVAAAIAIPYYCWEPLEKIVGPIVDATLVPVLTAVGL